MKYVEEEVGCEMPTPSVEENCNNFYGVEIRKVNNGFIVNVGCQPFVFEDKERMFQYVNMYLTNPIETEKAFRKGELFNK